MTKTKFAISQLTILDQRQSNNREVEFKLIELPDWSIFKIIFNSEV